MIRLIAALLSLSCIIHSQNADYQCIFADIYSNWEGATTWTNCNGTFPNNTQTTTFDALIYDGDLTISTTDSLSVNNLISNYSGTIFIGSPSFMANQILLSSNTSMGFTGSLIDANITNVGQQQITFSNSTLKGAGLSTNGMILFLQQNTIESPVSCVGQCSITLNSGASVNFLSQVSSSSVLLTSNTNSITFNGDSSLGDLQNAGAISFNSPVVSSSNITNNGIITCKSSTQFNLVNIYNRQNSSFTIQKPFNLTSGGSFGNYGSLVVDSNSTFSSLLHQSTLPITGPAALTVSKTFMWYQGDIEVNTLIIQGNLTCLGANLQMNSSNVILSQGSTLIVPILSQTVPAITLAPGSNLYLEGSLKVAVNPDLVWGSSQTYKIYVIAAQNVTVHGNFSSLTMYYGTGSAPAGCTFSLMQDANGIWTTCTVVINDEKPAPSHAKLIAMIVVPILAVVIIVAVVLFIVRRRRYSHYREI